MLNEKYASRMRLDQNDELLIIIYPIIEHNCKKLHEKVRWQQGKNVKEDREETKGKYVPRMSYRHVQIKTMNYW